jgi:hypothetical protein
MVRRAWAMVIVGWARVEVLVDRPRRMSDDARRWSRDGDIRLVRLN